MAPVRIGDDEITDADIASSRHAYPWIGVAIGLFLAAASLLLARTKVGPGLSAFLLLALWTCCSGSLHLDGLADTFDGIFLWGDSERRLKVMRDPHVGSFGVCAIALVLLGKFAALQELGGNAGLRALAMFGAAVIARSLILVSAGLANYARPTGTGRIMIEATTQADALKAALFVVVVALGVAGPIGLAVAIVLLILALGVTWLARERLGGVTGDTLGALVELSEVTCLVLMGLL